MEKLTNETGQNSPDNYSKIFLERTAKGIDDQDLRRWKMLLKYFRGGRLLDAGCLDSLVPLLAKKKYPKSECWGIDLAEEAIKHMRAMYPDVIYEVKDVYKTQFPNDYFSYIVAGELIEHLEMPSDFLQEAFRILKPEGMLAISTPLEEAIEPGAVDKVRHLWSFDHNDIYEMTKPWGTIIEVRILGSTYFPRYKYHFPTLLVWVEKNKQPIYERVQIQSGLHSQFIPTVLQTA